MDKAQVIDQMLGIFRSCEGNQITPEKALEGCAGLEIFEEPIFGMADASDPLFEQYKDPKVIGEPFMKPEEWLPGAQTVISFFLPFRERVRSSNKGNPSETSNEWLHARIDGQFFIEAFSKQLRDWFRERGEEACAPSIDPRFSVQKRVLPENDPEGIHVSSAWSERHAAYAAGLGTFCLSRGLISRKGVAGRYGSVIVTARYPADERPYNDIYEYCSRCGACIRACPVQAITLEHGKNQTLCNMWVSEITTKKYAPYYGCGKCQVGVPCEAGIPRKKIVK